MLVSTGCGMKSLYVLGSFQLKYGGGKKNKKHRIKITHSLIEKT